MIYTWAADITPLLEDACYQRYYLQAPDFRRVKADRMQQALGRAQSIGVWALYAEMREWFNLDGSEPYNFSHSGTQVICSVHLGESGMDERCLVGCDVEMRRPCNMRMAKRYFCESEWRSLVEAPEAERDTLFCRYWVLKESFMKATGQGMALPLNAFEICLGEPSKLIRKPEQYPESFSYREYMLGDGAYRAAVCTTDRQIDPKVRQIRLGR